jgi:hypothetical protein
MMFENIRKIGKQKGPAEKSLTAITPSGNFSKKNIRVD